MSVIGGTFGTLLGTTAAYVLSSSGSFTITGLVLFYAMARLLALESKNEV